MPKAERLRRRMDRADADQRRGTEQAMLTRRSIISREVGYVIEGIQKKYYMQYGRRPKSAGTLMRG